METNGDIYIGRPSILGNPFSHLESYDKTVVRVATRDEAIDRYEEYAEELMSFDNEYSREINRLRELHKKKDLCLVCFCKSPGKEVRCHGDIIKKLIET